MDANPYEVTPEEQQAILAQVLRGKQAMQLANEQANRFNNMAAIAQMANNPGAAKAAALAQTSAQKQYGMEKLGTQGFASPATGEFVPSQMFLEEKAQARAQARGLQAERQQSLQEMQAARLQAAKELQAQKDQAAWERAQLLATMRAALAGTKDNDKVDRNAEKDAQGLTKLAQAQGLPRLIQMTDKLNQIVKDAGDADVAGFGYGSQAISQTPLLSDVLLGEKGKSNRSVLQNVINALLAADSGKAVTLSEEQRAALTNMSTGRFSNKDTRNAIRDIITPIVEGMRANTLAGYSDAARDLYRRNHLSVGGAYDWTRNPGDSNGEKGQGQGQGSVPSGVDPALWKHMTPEERKLWQK